MAYGYTPPKCKSCGSDYDIRPIDLVGYLCVTCRFHMADQCAKARTTQHPKEQK